jgi:hypothetical protein
VITSLTGGDPTRLCATLSPTLRVIVAWAESVLGDPPSDAGITDMVYGPLLVREIGAYVDAAPIELAERAAPLLARAKAAVAQLHVLGLNAPAVQQLADQAQARLQGSGQPDGATVRDELANTLQTKVPEARLRNAAVVFTASQPDPATVLDLGYVSPSVTQAAGFNCPDIVATL